MTTKHKCISVTENMIYFSVISDLFINAYNEEKQKIDSVPLKLTIPTPEKLLDLDIENFKVRFDDPVIILRGTSYQEEFCPVSIKSFNFSEDKKNMIIEYSINSIEYLSSGLASLKLNALQNLLFERNFKGCFFKETSIIDENKSVKWNKEYISNYNSKIEKLIKKNDKVNSLFNRTIETIYKEKAIDNSCYANKISLKDDMFTEIWSYAWMEKHSSGYDEVSGTATEILDLFYRIKNTN